MMKNREVIIELFRQTIRAWKNEHIDHISFDVDDIDKPFSILKEASFTMVEDSTAHLPSFDE